MRVAELARSTPFEVTLIQARGLDLIARNDPRRPTPEEIDAALHTFKLDGGPFARECRAALELQVQQQGGLL